MHVQNEVDALLFCQDHRVLCELKKDYSLFPPFFERRAGTAQRPLQHPPRTLRHLSHHPCGSGTIYNNHTLESFKDLGLDYQRVQKLASKLHNHSVNYAAKLVHTRRALSSTNINSR